MLVAPLDRGVEPLGRMEQEFALERAVEGDACGRVGCVAFEVEDGINRCGLEVDVDRAILRPRDNFEVSPGVVLGL